MRALEGLVLATFVALVLVLAALLAVSVLALWRVWAAGLRWEAVVLLAAIGSEWVQRLRAERRARKRIA